MSRRRASSRSSRRLVFFLGRGLACGGLLATVTCVPSLGAQEEKGAPAAGSGTTIFDAISHEVHDLFEHSREAVVKIEASDEHGPLSGTGFFIDPHGTIYTSYTIGGTSEEITILHDGHKLPAKRLFSDARSGIALLQADVESSFLTLGTATNLTVASPIVAIGYAMDFPVSPQFGMIAGFDLRHHGRLFSTSHIRANLPVQRGEGGAPLLNLKGEVVGIIVSSVDDGPGCFALPIDAAEKVRKDFIRFGEARPGWLGIEVVNGSKLKVNDLLPETPAMDSGLRKGDQLLQVGGRAVATVEDLQNACFYLTVGDPVAIEVLRNDEHVTVTARPSEHPTMRRVSPPMEHSLPLQMGQAAAH